MHRTIPFPKGGSPRLHMHYEKKSIPARPLEKCADPDEDTKPGAVHNEHIEIREGHEYQADHLHVKISSAALICVRHALLLSTGFLSAFCGFINARKWPKKGP